MKKIILILSGLTLMTLPTALQTASASESQTAELKKYNSSGKIYRASLLKAIQDADEITVAEHSNLYDYWQYGKNKQEDYAEKVYALVKISPKEKLVLIDSIRVLDTRMPEAIPACIIEPHHRISFYSKGELTSTMEVCFKCGQIAWSGSLREPPAAMYGAMWEFISRIGLHPEAEWRDKYMKNASESKS